MEGGASTFTGIGAVTAVPAFAMALGSAAISAGEPSERLEVRLQHFSAGLLIGAVITNIFPLLRERLISKGVGGHKEVHWNNLLAGFLGFTFALMLMYGVKGLGLEEEEVQEVQDAEDKDGGPSVCDSQAMLEWRQSSWNSSKVGSMRSVEQLSKASDLVSPLLLPPHPGAAVPSGLEKRNIHHAVARLHAHASALALLVEEDEVDREAVDEEVHGIDFLLDAARRSCRKASPVQRSTAQRLREHAAELAEDIAQARVLDDLHAIDKQLKVIADTLRHIHSHVDHGVFRRWRPLPCRERTAQSLEGAAPLKVPWGLVLAVVIDSVLDGMLIGLAGSVAIMSGWLMAVATAIEMGFLGYSFACSIIKSVQRWRVVAILSLPPLAMLAASMAAFAGARGVEDQPTFVGLIAFALVALLFLVVEELLLEAHDKEGSEVWHISGWLYVGLLLSICLDMAV